jgi:hypothetical protein
MLHLCVKCRKLKNLNLNSTDRIEFYTFLINPEDALSDSVSSKLMKALSFALARLLDEWGTLVLKVDQDLAKQATEEIGLDLPWSRAMKSGNSAPIAL